MTIATDPGSDRNEAGGELHPTGRRDGLRHLSMTEFLVKRGKATEPAQAPVGME